MLNATLGNVEVFRRNLEDNIRIKEIEQKLSAIEEGIKKLEEKVKGAADEEAVNKMKQLGGMIGMNFSFSGFLTFQSKAA